ncbi:DEAD/DEAH box helicase [Caldinitratiruptor microaerophilus]|uniref:Helicase n=1 Tax=Caldinitratiruptor microaerophilus TaxID=671077 RepID=A0AA35CL32_9FIRM|nr:DEAD/DEAH box helicase [Caldinitratiruptor microaerophilus]BDG60398.1 helicase [Caldinitratiruptor microaerophilus]
MLTVHGSYVPHGPGGFVFLWAMDPEGEADAAWRSLAAHPAVAPVPVLYPVLRGLPFANTLTCVVWMPRRGTLAPARVTGVALSLPGAAQWLLDLDRAFQGTALRPGRSLQVWSTAAKLLLELLARGRFLPVLRAEAGCLTAAWRLAPPEPAEAARRAALAAALPDVCRAIVPPDRQYRAYRIPTPEELVDGFFTAGADALARDLLAGAPAPAPAALNPAAAQHWLLALVGPPGRDLPPGLPDAGDLLRAVDEWTAPATGLYGPGQLRTGLRLLPPDRTRHGGWEVELVLETPDDPPAILPAAAAWDGLGAEVEIGGRRYAHPEHRLLTDLPAMARLYPPLTRLLGQTAPSALPVSEDEVLALLEEGAALLQEAGFPVLLPANLVRQGELRARLRLRPVGEGPGRFGLSELVQVDWELALGGAPVDLRELERLAREKRALIRHAGQWVRVDPQVLAAALRHLRGSGGRLPLGEVLRLAGGGAAAGGAPSGAGTAVEVESVEAEGWVANLLERLREPARIEPVAPPGGLAGTLRPYQRRGLDWLAFLRRYGAGACLADDMGLGKTVQVIALLLHEREEGLTDRPTLLICPVSLVGNWRRELARFAPSLRVLVHHGSGRAAEDGFVAAALAHDVVITTYSLLPRDEAALAAVPWAGIVADEAQNVKNPDTRHAEVLRRLARGAPGLPPPGYRIALTGTPVENRLGDLWSIFAFLNPGLLGSREDFQRAFAVPIERYRDPEAAARLRRLVQPFLLRRVKTDPAVELDLPEKIETTVYTTLTREQAALYEAVVQETLERAERAEGIERHGAVLAGLTRLKQVCNHPAAVTGDGGRLEGRSGKLDRLTEMLDEVVAGGDQALVFTQFPSFAERLRPYLEERLGCPVLALDGSTPQRERDRRIAAFQAGEAPVFLLSLKAGGVGLNLTAASHVFHFDRWWNPAVEDQAADRAHRIGQARRVLVHRLVTAGTLEERIDRLLEEKRALSAEVVASGEAWLGQLSTEELRRLIVLEKE